MIILIIEKYNFFQLYNNVVYTINDTKKTQYLDTKCQMVSYIEIRNYF